MNLIKNPILINEVVHQENCDINVEGDIIVPDVKPDILKILQVDAISSITKKESQKGKLVISGKVNLKILYIPDRCEENVKSILTSFDFTHQVDNPNQNDNINISIESDISHVDFNLINSRKLNVHTIISLNVTVFCGKELEFLTDVENDVYTEISRKPLNIYSNIAACEEEFIVKDSLEIPSGKVSVKDILKIDYKISDKDFKPVTGKIVAKGTVNACILYNGDNNNIEFLEIDIPFTEVFNADNVTETSGCEINYNVIDMFYEICEDSDGDNRIINLEFQVDTQIDISENINLDIIDDFYCPGHELEINKEMHTINNIACQTGSQNNIREIVSVNSNLPQIVGVYNVITKAFITNTSVENNKLLVEGVIDCYILYLSDNTDNPIYSFKKEIPFSCLLDTPNCTDSMERIVNAEIEHCSYSLNIANEVELRCILSVTAKILDKQNIDIICGCNLSELTAASKMGIVIYFVQRGDTLWNIAKRYHIAINDIVSLNKLDISASLSVGQQLIIPVSKKKPA